MKNKSPRENAAPPVRPAAESTADDVRTERADAAAEMNRLAQKYDEPKKHSWKFWLKCFGLLCVFAAGAVILLLMANEFDKEGDKLPLGEINPWVYLALLVLFAAMLLLQTAKFGYMQKISIGKARFALGLRVNLVGKFYDNVTPMSTGGQPFQMYYYHKNGVDLGNATSLPTMNYIIQMYAWQIVSFIFLVANGNCIFGATDHAAAVTIKIMCWFGWTLNMFAPLLFLSLAFFPKIAYALVRGIVKLGHKLHVVKDYDITLKKGYDLIDSYKHALTLMGKQFRHILGMTLLSALEFLVLLSVPMVLAYYISDTPLTFSNWATMATLYCYVIYSVTFLPSPGASGFTEASLALVFMKVATPGTLFWLLFMMRFFTYYIFIILGLVVTARDAIVDTVKNKRARKAALIAAVETGGSDKDDIQNPTERIAETAYEEIVSHSPEIQDNDTAFRVKENRTNAPDEQRDSSDSAAE